MARVPTHISRETPPEHSGLARPTDLSALVSTGRAQIGAEIGRLGGTKKDLARRQYALKTEADLAEGDKLFDIAEGEARVELSQRPNEPEQWVSIYQRHMRKAIDSIMTSSFTPVAKRRLKVDLENKLRHREIDIRSDANKQREVLSINTIKDATLDKYLRGDYDGGDDVIMKLKDHGYPLDKILSIQRGLKYDAEVHGIDLAVKEKDFTRALDLIKRAKSFTDAQRDAFKEATKHQQKIHRQTIVEPQVINEQISGKLTTARLEELQSTGQIGDSIYRWLLDDLKAPKPTETNYRAAIESVGDLNKLWSGMLSKESAQDKFIRTRFKDRKLSQADFIWFWDILSKGYKDWMYPGLAQGFEGAQEFFRSPWVGAEKESKRAFLHHQALTSWLDGEVEAGRTPTIEQILTQSQTLQAAMLEGRGAITPTEPRKILAWSREEIPEESPVGLEKYWPKMNEAEKKSAMNILWSGEKSVDDISAILEKKYGK